MDKRRLISALVKEASSGLGTRRKFVKTANYGVDTMRGAVTGGIAGAARSIVPMGIGAGIGALVPVSGDDDAARRRKRLRNALIGGVGGILAREGKDAIAARSLKSRLVNLASMGVGAGVGAFSGNRKNGRLSNALRGAILGDLLYNSGSLALYNGMAYAGS